jgi:membrane protein YqaA with SNARE-associated domain
MAYLSLFFVSFFAATILPVSSEVVLFGMLSSKNYINPLLLFSASFGNILGSCVNWFLGIHFVRFQNKNWFPFSQATISKASVWFNKYGQWSLLFSWVPVIGDPLTFIAGTLKINIYKQQ